MPESVNTVSRSDAVNQPFITCHHYIGTLSTTSSQTHWHNEIEIIHCIAGEGFIHTSQCVSVEFNAPAIVIIPANLIHRTTFPPKCRINRIKFSPNTLTSGVSDPALTASMTQLLLNPQRSSIVLLESDQGFKEIRQLICHLAYLTDPNVAYCTELATHRYQQEQSAEHHPNSISSSDHNRESLSAAKNIAKSTTSLFGSAAAQVPAAANTPDESLDLAVRELMHHLHFTLHETLQACARMSPEQNMDPLFHSNHSNHLEFTANTTLNYSNAANTSSDNNATNSCTGSTYSDSAGGESGSRYIDNGPSLTSKAAFNEQDLIQFKTLGTILQIKATLLHLIGTLFEFSYLGAPRNLRRPRIGQVTETKVKLMLNYIHDNSHRPININELSEQLGVTNQYFCRFFKMLTNMRFIDYLNTMRVQQAAVEIAFTHTPIGDISYRSGFDKMTYFIKLFREHFRVSPSQFRRAFQDKNGDTIARIDPSNGLLLTTGQELTTQSDSVTADELLNNTQDEYSTSSAGLGLGSDSPEGQLKRSRDQNNTNKHLRCRSIAAAS